MQGCSSALLDKWNTSTKDQTKKIKEDKIKQGELKIKKNKTKQRTSKGIECQIGEIKRAEQPVPGNLFKGEQGKKQL